MTVQRIVFLAFVCLCGCAHQKQLTWQLKRTTDMIEQVATLVPEGSTIEEAIRLMEAEGFKCKVERDSTFVAAQHWSKQEPKYEHLTFIQCNRQNTNAGFGMFRVWSVAIVLDSDRTSNQILVAHYIDGL